MKPGTEHRSPGIYRDEKTPGKLQLGDCLMNAVRPVIASKRVPYLDMRLVGLHPLPR